MHVLVIVHVLVVVHARVHVAPAYQKGSGDNLTATVIEFGWVSPEQVTT